MGPEPLNNLTRNGRAGRDAGMGAGQVYKVFIMISGTAWTGIRRISPTLPPNDLICREIVPIGTLLPQRHAPRTMLVPGQASAETQPRKRRTCPPDEGLSQQRNRPGTTVT